MLPTHPFINTTSYPIYFQDQLGTIKIYLHKWKSGESGYFAQEVSYKMFYTTLFTTTYDLSYATVCKRCRVWRLMGNGMEFQSVRTGVAYEWEHDDVIKWKHFPRYWPFVRGIHRGHTKASDTEL